MSAFPRLKTGAVAQYPVTRALTYATEVVQFVDGSDQRYRTRRIGRRWVVRLALLDDTEVARLAEFFTEVQGRCGSFAFEDPWSGDVHPNCSLDNDVLEAEMLGEGRGRLELIVRENV